MVSDPDAAPAPRLLDRLGPCPRIAVLRASRIGDVICALPALSDLKTAVPGCHLTLVALPLVRDLARRVPFIDEIAPFPGFPGIAEQFFEPRGALRFFRRMQAQHFDLAIQMHGSGTYSNPFTLMLGAALTAGFVADGRDLPLLDAALPLEEEWCEVERCRRLTSLLGAPPGEAAEYVRPNASDKAAARRLLTGHPRPWMAMHPWARDPHKVWPLGRYLQVAAELFRLHGGTMFILGAGEDALPTAEMMRRVVSGRPTSPLVDLIGRTPLPQLAAVMAQLDLFIGNDSGPAHLAYALRCPSVTIFGGTDPLRWGPGNWPGADPRLHAVIALPSQCRPCEAGDCTRLTPCLDELPVATVVAEASALLACRPARSGKRMSPPSLAGSK